MRWMLLAAVASLTCVVACDDDAETTTPTTVSQGGSGATGGEGGTGGSGGEPVCGSANLPLDISASASAYIFVGASGFKIFAASDDAQPARTPILSASEHHLSALDTTAWVAVAIPSYGMSLFS